MMSSIRSVAQKDTTVRLEVLPADAGPDGKHQTIALVRKKVSIEEQAAKSSVIDVKNGTTAHKIGVISLPTFYEDFDARRRGDKDYKSATRDVAKQIAELKKQNVDGILVDLRNNGGGSLSEAIDLTGLFTGKGPVVQVRAASGRIEEGRNLRTEMAWDGPLGVHRQSQFGVGFGNFRGGDPGLRPRPHHRRTDVRQRHGAESRRSRSAQEQREADARRTEDDDPAVLPRRRRIDAAARRLARHRFPDHCGFRPERRADQRKRAARGHRSVPRTTRRRRT